MHGCGKWENEFFIEPFTGCGYFCYEMFVIGILGIMYSTYINLYINMYYMPYSVITIPLSHCHKLLIGGGLVPTYL